MTQIIDRRLNGKNKSAVNRQRFIQRYKQQIREAVAHSIAGRSIKDIERGGKVRIPARDLREPAFRHGPGGTREMVHPGNREFQTGDTLPRPDQGTGRGSGASEDGEGMDDFVFELSREEFLQFFFDDLELPDLVKTQLATIVEHTSVRAGYTSDGVPSNIDVVRSLKGALARRIALQGPHKRQLREVEAQLALVEEAAEDAPGRALLEDEAVQLRRRIDAIPFIDTFDLRYSNRIQQPKPTTQAVMFCLMDVSGSMDEQRKEIAKRFFILLYLFLTRSYERIEVVFIRHHTTAKEVDEEDFFHSRETGGTVVSSALALMYRILQERYSSNEWNVYAAQASDGDNWDSDSPRCRNMLIDRIMPCVQYYAYVEITPDREQSLWREYQQVAAVHPHFAMRKLAGVNGIYPVFRELFKRRTA